MHLDATPEAGKAFYQSFHTQGKVVMLNLLRFKAQADYSGLENIAPESPLTGKEAYTLYMQHTLPHLQAAGGQVLFQGESQHFLIGPEAEQWDMVLLVEHASVERFMAFAQNPAYMKTAGHRTAALADSRLLPITQKH